MVSKARPVESSEIPAHFSGLERCVAQVTPLEGEAAPPPPSKRQKSKLLGELQAKYPTIFGSSPKEVIPNINSEALDGSQSVSGSGGGAMGIGGIGSYGNTTTKRGYGDVNLGSGTEKAMTADDLKAEGLPKEIIGKIIERHLPQVQYAIDRAPGSHGTLVVKFVIGPKGKVQSVKLTGDRFPEEFRSQIRGIFMSMEFPAPRGGGTVSVTYPLKIK